MPESEIGRQLFADGLRDARQAAGLSQEALGELVGVTGSRVGQWESTHPIDPEAVFALERALKLPGGRLSRHLGYVPAGEIDSDVVGAIEADPRLDDVGRGILIASYRAAVKTSGARS